MLTNVKSKEKSAMNVFLKNKIRLKETLINTTEKQTKLLANDMYINQMKINKLNKELLVLKEDYAKMIVKSYKADQNKVGRCLYYPLRTFTGL
jgi:hypothetical protein